MPERLSSAHQSIMSDNHEAIVTPTPEGFQPHHVAHHYVSHEQEFQSCKMAFWLFLATEILLFGGLFAAYFAYHGMYPETFVEGGKQLKWQLGALNTCILLCSSWTMAMAVRATQLNQRKAAIRLLLLTLAGAAGFMVVKYFEYMAKIEHGLVPGHFFHDHHGVMSGLPFPELFFSLYFTMTGIHGAHVLIGAGLIVWVTVGVAKGRYHSGHFLPVDLVGLYWHLVDLIWIFLFPLLYLVP